MNTPTTLLTILSAGLLAACGGGGGGGNATSSTNGAPPTNTVTGKVMFKGAPLPGATVIAYDSNGNRVFQAATTDANGQYSFSGFGTFCTDCQPTYALFASKPGYAFYPSLASNPTGSRAAYVFNTAPQTWFVPNGAAVARAGFNGVFTNPNGGAGIMFNVITYISVPNNSIVGANFTAYDVTTPLVSLPATGQQTSYVAGDDAALQKGVASPAVRFVDNHDGTVTDNLTGLVWLKNAGCFAPTVWASALADANQLASGMCGLTDGSTAGQWRMPNLIELESIVDASAANPAVTPGNPFINISNGIYWTSTDYFGGEVGSFSAWTIRMSDGRYINDGIANYMTTANNAVWAVRGAGGGAVHLQATGAYVPAGPGDDGTIQNGVPLTAPRMIDNGNGTVTDTMTGLTWMKLANCINQPWAQAVAAVQALASGQCGLSDGSAPGSWRMPNRKEMQSLADRGQNNQALYFDETFNSGQPPISSQQAAFTNFIQFQYYWTSTTNASDPTEAWTVFSCDYGVYDIPKTNTGYTLAVR
ncbi:MAG: DUF1566 domain-containing protein [Burkholderiales bacterium]|nr:DUF1566 domain-containing protein [Burkholderiales bacterium]